MGTCMFLSLDTDLSIDQSNRLDNLLCQLNQPSEETYYVRFNYDTPFKVCVDDQTVKVYKRFDWRDRDRQSEYITFPTEPILTLNPSAVFVGRSPSIGITTQNATDSTHFDGNSILLHTHGLTYMFIGREIYTFQAVDQIIGFVSPVGPNDCPYPYAIDKQNNLYLLTENVVLVNSPEVSDRMKLYEEPYKFYYENCVIFDWDGTDVQENWIWLSRGIGCGSQRLGGTIFAQMKSFYVGPTQRILTYKPFAKREFDRLVKKAEGDVYVTNLSGEKIVLSRDLFASLMESFGSASSFEPILHKNVFQKELWV